MVNIMNTLGKLVTVTLFGESRGELVGAVVDGLRPGTAVDRDFIDDCMRRRRGAASLSTPRREADEVRIVSGVYNGLTTGAPVAIIIENIDVRDDGNLPFLRPGHADFTAAAKYCGHNDPRGGGHLSARLTAPLVAAGALAQLELSGRGILIGTHILSCGDIADDGFSADISGDIMHLRTLDLPLLNSDKAEAVASLITRTGAEGDSLGGITQTAIVGLPVGTGEPYFDSVESLLAHAMFSIPACKGVEFGAGFELARMKGSEANDAFYTSEKGIITATNNCGGILGGIADGMPVTFNCAFKPTPTISKPQHTVEPSSNTEVLHAFGGRHDPAAVLRAPEIVTALTALTVCDLLRLS